MSNFLKTLIAIPIVIYLAAIFLVSYTFRGHSSLLLILFLAFIGLITIVIFVLLITIFIRTLSLLKLSESQSFAVSLWLPILLWGTYISYDIYSGSRIKQKDYDNYFTQGDWEYKYVGKEEKVLIAAQKFAEDKVLSKFDYKKYFTVIRPLTNDSSKYEAFYYYADPNHPDTSSMMIVHIISDSDGHIFSSEKLCTYDSVRLKEIFNKNIESIQLMTNLIDSTPKHN
jgi:hypothetical protein